MFAIEDFGLACRMSSLCLVADNEAFLPPATFFIDQERVRFTVLRFDSTVLMSQRLLDGSLVSLSMELDLLTLLKHSFTTAFGSMHMIWYRELA
jgi:hypothetical protein